MNLFGYCEGFMLRRVSLSADLGFAPWMFGRVDARSHLDAHAYTCIAAA